MVDTMQSLGPSGSEVSPQLKVTPPLGTTTSALVADWGQGRPPPPADSLPSSVRAAELRHALGRVIAKVMCGWG